MTDELKNNVNKLLSLPEDLLEIFFSKLHPVKISKAQNFLSEGQFCRHLAIVQKGGFYSFYLKDGNEIVEGFCFEGCFIADYPSFIKGIPVKKNFKALENSHLLIISKEQLEELYSSDWRFQKTGRLVAEHLFASWEQKVREVILKTPAERYKNLLAGRQDVLQRVPQYLIASYLNITPEYLSKLRSKIIS